MLLYTKVFTSLFDITFIRNALVGEIPFSKTLNFLFVQKKIVTLLSVVKIKLMTLCLH
jgi:hypothetical protein